MIKKITLFFTVLSLFLFGNQFLPLLLAEEAPPQAGKEIVVIVNSKTVLGLEMTSKELKDIYLGEMAYKKTVRLLPVNLKQDNLSAVFMEKFIGISLKSYLFHWKKKIFAEGGSLPEIFENSKEVVAHVSQNQGGIGYLYKSDLQDENKSVIVIKIAKKDKEGIVK